MNHVCVPCCYHYSQNEVRAGSWTDPNYILATHDTSGKIEALPVDSAYWFKSNPNSEEWVQYSYDGPIQAHDDYVTSITLCPDPTLKSCTPCNIDIGKVNKPWGGQGHRWAVTGGPCGFVAPLEGQPYTATLVFGENVPKCYGDNCGNCHGDC